MKGSISIGRPTPGDYIEITVEDDMSGVEFLRARVGLIDFAKMMTGLGNVDCEFDLYAKYVGMKSEMKVIDIPVQNYSIAKHEKEVILTPYQVEGWKARESDLGNHHNMKRTKDGYLCSVMFSRFVPADSKEPTT